MEQGMEIMQETVAVLIFVIALSVIFAMFHSLSQLEAKAKQNLYDQHVLYSSKVETQ